MRRLKPKRYLLLIVLLFLTAACSALDRPIAIPPIAATPTLTAEPTRPPIHTPTASQSTAPGPTQATSVNSPTPDGPAAFDGQRALAHVQMLAGSIGKRVAGSQGGRQAADYLKAQFQSYGYQVAEVRFPFEAFEEKETKLAVVSPTPKSIGAAALLYSPPGHVTAQVVAVPNPGRPEDYQKIDVKDKIALVQRGQFFLRDKVRNAAQAGAAAVLIYNSEPQSYVGTLQEPATIPALALSGVDGQTLLALLKQGPITLQLDTETQIAQREGVNVVATRPGSGNDVLVFGAHYDSVQTGPGANDNASGTAIVLELARVLARTQRPETLVFIGFDAEELGLLGSRAYVDQLPAEERRRIKAMFNFDELGATDNRLILIGSEPLVRQAEGIAQRLTIDARAGGLDSGGSDHEPFIRAGVPALFFFREDPLFHTPQDTPDRVRAEWLAAAGQIAVQMANDQ